MSEPMENLIVVIVLLVMFSLSLKGIEMYSVYRYKKEKFDEYHD
jgi:hypothetical protein